MAFTLRDTEQGPTPAAPPRREGVAGCPYAPRVARGGAVQREAAQPLRGTYAYARPVATPPNRSPSTCGTPGKASRSASRSVRRADEPPVR